ncbi:MAG TPA: hypothetical protein EYG51_16610, partial [Pseudomonadales bacterium]|nr:hypothetical protein [Pseudomonadales bacterium]
MSETRQSTPLGPIADRFSHRELIGAGSAKQVHLALDTLVNRLVAVAVIENPPDDLNNEIVTWASIADHPQVVTIYDVINHPHTTYIIQQYLEGKNLRDRITNSPLSELEALECSLQLTRILKDTHKEGFIHSDLKPENILFDRAGLPYLCDFGASKTAEWISLDIPTSMTGGSVGYMAPEQLLRASAAPTVDIYSLGCLMFEMMTGTAAFVGEPRAIYASKVDPAFSPPTSNHFSTPVANLLTSLMAFEPTRRPDDMQQLEQRLVAVIEELIHSNKTARSPIWGYQDQRQTFNSLLRDANRNRPRLILIDGAAGMGKSTLIETFLSTTQSTVRVVCEKASAQMVEPLSLFKTCLNDLGPDFLIKIEKSDTRFHEPEFRNFATTIIDHLCNENDILVFDDIHWADETSLNLLQQLILRLTRNKATGPTVILGYRPDELEEDLAMFIDDLHLVNAHRICLDGLKSADISALLTSEFNATPSVQLVTAIKKTSMGNPLFTLELIKHIRKTSQFDIIAGSLQVTVEIDALDLPANLVAALANRLNHLSDECQRAMTYAALLGEIFDPGVLQTILELPDAQWLLIKDSAEQNDVIRMTGYEFEFTHPLVRNHFLTRPSAPRREKAHANIAEKLILHYTDTVMSHSIEIAHHIVRSGHLLHSQEFTRFSTDAGNKALKLFSFERARRFFEYSCQALKHSDDAHTLAQLHLSIGLSYGLSSDLAQGIQHLLTSIDYFTKTEDVNGLAAALEHKLRYDTSAGKISHGELADVNPLESIIESITNQETLVNSLDSLATAHYYAGNISNAESYASTAMEIAEASGDLRLCCVPVSSLALTKLDQFQIEAARDLWRDGVANAKKANLDLADGYHSQRLPLTLFYLGELEEALRLCRVAYQFGQDTNNIAELTIPLSIEIMVNILRGNFPEAVEKGEEALEIVKMTRYPWAATAIIPALAQTYTLQGKTVEAFDILEQLVTGEIFENTAPYQDLHNNIKSVINA